MRFLLLFLLCSPLFAQPGFDTGNNHRDKYLVGAGATMGGLALINHTEGPTEAIGVVWAVGGVANLISGEIESITGYSPSQISGRKKPCLF